MKLSYLISLFIYIFLLISPANAGKIDLIIDLFKGGKKLITGGADEAKDVGKVLEDFKCGNNEVKDIGKVIEDLKSEISKGLCGAPARSRTADLLITNQF